MRGFAEKKQGEKPLKRFSQIAEASHTQLKLGVNEKDLGPYYDSPSYLAAVVRGKLQPEGLSSLSNNMIVTEILDAARESARTGKRVDLH